MWSVPESIRFLDPGSGGISYLIIPDFIKEPLAGSYKFESKEIIDTKAGHFHVNKIISIAADPFIGKLMEPMLKKWVLWVEDSDRRLVVKTIFVDGSKTILESISNIEQSKQ